MFVRSARLPNTVDVNTINAAYANGTLSVVFAKSKAAKPKRIAVKFAEKGMDHASVRIVGEFPVRE